VRTTNEVGVVAQRLFMHVPPSLLLFVPSGQLVCCQVAPPRSAPVAAATDLMAELEERLAEGEFIVVHCRAGIGRSSLIAAAVLVREGLSPAEPGN
jgi:hypothetical protein